MLLFLIDIDLSFKGIIAFVLFGILIVIILVIGTSGEDEQPQRTYNAAFGDPSEHLDSGNEGFAVVGDQSLTKEDSYTNVALFGPTGSGKSSVVIFGSIRSLRRGKSSIVINDVSGELHSTRRYLDKNGYTTFSFNPADAKTSECFNPLLLCNSISDCNKLALILVQNAIGEAKGDPFWENSARMLIALMCRYLIFYEDPDYQTLQNVLRLVEKFAVDPKAVDKLFVKTDECTLDAYKATLSMGEKTLQSVVATARTALQLFNDTQVCKTTSINTIDFELLRKQPTAIYISSPLKDLKYFKPLNSLFFQSLFDFTLSRLPGEKNRSIFFLLDEFATMRFPDIAVTVSNIRKYKAGMLLCMQDEMSLVAQYGQAEAHQIKTNCGTQVYLPGQPLHTCRELSQILGRYTMVDEEGKEKGTRELMTPDEIRLCKEAIILKGNNPPLKCPTVPYYDMWFTGGLVSKEPYPHAQKDIPVPPIIKFA